MASALSIPLLLPSDKRTPFTLRETGSDAKNADGHQGVLAGSYFL